MPAQVHPVELMESAVRDLEAIARFISRDAPANARRVLERLESKTDDLARFPERGRIVPELARFGIVEYREVITRPYRVVYRLRGRHVQVLAVIDGRRQAEDLLFERMAFQPPEPRPYDIPRKRDRRKKK